MQVRARCVCICVCVCVGGGCSYVYLCTSDRVTYRLPPSPIPAYSHTASDRKAHTTSGAPIVHQPFLELLVHEDLELASALAAAVPLGEADQMARWFMIVLIPQGAAMGLMRELIAAGRHLRGGVLWCGVWCGVCCGVWCGVCCGVLWLVFHSRCRQAARVSGTFNDPARFPFHISPTPSAEVDRITVSTTLFRSNSMSSKLLTAYAKLTLKSFVRGLLEPVVERVYADDVVLEIGNPPPNCVVVWWWVPFHTACFLSLCACFYFRIPIMPSLSPLYSRATSRKPRAQTRTGRQTRRGWSCRCAR